MIKTILLILATASFCLAAAGASIPHVNLIPIGLALFSASFIDFKKS